VGRGDVAASLRQTKIGAFCRHGFAPEKIIELIVIFRSIHDVSAITIGIFQTAHHR